MATAERQHPTPGRLAPTTAAAIERLKRGQPGHLVTEQEMAQIIGQPCPPQTYGYNIIARAAAHVLREYHVSWRRDRTIPGWRCETPQERVQYVCNTGTRKVRNASKKNIRLLAVASDQLSAEEKRDQQIMQVTHGMVFMASTGRFRHQVISTVADCHRLSKPTAPALIALMGNSEKT